MGFAGAPEASAAVASGAAAFEAVELEAAELEAAGADVSDAESRLQLVQAKRIPAAPSNFSVHREYFIRFLSARHIAVRHIAVRHAGINTTLLPEVLPAICIHYTKRFDNDFYCGYNVGTQSPGTCFARAFVLTRIRIQILIIEEVGTESEPSEGVNLYRE
jgi:hypothetical protein